MESRNFRARKNVLEYDNVMNTQREVIYAQRQKVLDGEDLRENMMQMLRSLVESDVSTALSGHGGVVNEDGLKGLANAMEGIYFAKGTLASRREQLLAMSADQLTDTVFEIARHTYEAKEAAYTPKIMRELERVIMLRVVDEYWMDNIDAMDDLKQGIGLRAYGQHDPVVAYKEEGYQMFEAMITAIKEETIRRMFLVQLRPGAGGQAGEGGQGDRHLRPGQVSGQACAGAQGAQGRPQRPLPLRQRQEVQEVLHAEGQTRKLR